MNKLNLEKNKKNGTTGLRKKQNQEAFNVSFMTTANMEWYHLSIKKLLLNIIRDNKTTPKLEFFSVILWHTCLSIYAL